MKHNESACQACRAELCPHIGTGRQDGGSFVLHSVAAAALATALTILGTAGDLGPFAPMLIASGLYLAVFGLVIYVAIAVRAFVRLVRRQRNDRGDRALETSDVEAFIPAPTRGQP